MPTRCHECGGWLEPHLADEESNASFFDSLSSIFRLIVEPINRGFSESVGCEEVGAKFWR